LSGAHKSWGVPVASIVLVGAVWISLQLSRTAPVERAAPEVPSSATPDRLEGFRPEAWYLPDDSLLGFVRVEAGPFLMGSDLSRDPLAYDIERFPGDIGAEPVDLTEYYIGRFEVTVAQYAAFAKDADYTLAEPAALEAPPDHPVARVAWTEALAYVRWLDGTLRTGDGATPPALRALLDGGWRVALPDEAQWEKAARDGDGRIYPWGDEPRDGAANFGARGAVPVGSFPCAECPFGLADMAGNVWEWTSSPYQPYPTFGESEAIDLDSEALWVMRGGSFRDDERNVRAAARGGADPGARRDFIGFRVALVHD